MEMKIATLKWLRIGNEYSIGRFEAMSEKERAFWKREFGNYGLENAGNSINSSSSYATSNLSHCSSISEKESEADERISGLNRVGKESDMALETMTVVPYLGNETNMTVGSTHSHEKAIVYGDSGEGKVGSRIDEVKQLSRRLELLEEDTQLMKKVFVRKVEERHELLNEISQHLQAIQEHLTCSNIKDKSLKINSIINTIKGRSTDAGLPQVLHQDQNTTIVTNRKVNMIVLQGPHWPTQEYLRS